MTVDLLRDDLENLQAQLDEINQQVKSESTTKSPYTTLEIQNKESSERAWQRYLKYFCDPGKPHQLQSTFLEHFIGMLQAEGKLSPTLDPDYDDIVVREEEPGDGSRPDLLIYEPGEWFICFELKVYQSERSGQTEDHVASPVLGQLEKDTIPKAHHYYLYVAPRWAGDGEAEQFEACPWIGRDEEPSIVRTIDSVLDSLPKGTPTRTGTQLREFRDTIHNELAMTTIDEATEEKKELYMENRATIAELEQAFEKYANWFFDTRVPAALNGEYRPSYWDDEWVYNAYSGHTKLYHESWRPSDDVDAHLEFYPKPEKLADGRIHVRFDIEHNGSNWESADGRRPQQIFADEVLAKIDRAELPEETTVTEEVDSGIHKLFDTRYEFHVGSDEDYLSALKSALEDMAPIIPAVDEAIAEWDETVEAVRDDHQEVAR